MNEKYLDEDGNPFNISMKIIPINLKMGRMSSDGNVTVGFNQRLKI